MGKPSLLCTYNRTGYSLILEKQMSLLVSFGLEGPTQGLSG